METRPESIQRMLRDENFTEYVNGPKLYQSNRDGSVVIDYGFVHDKRWQGELKHLVEYFNDDTGEFYIQTICGPTLGSEYAYIDSIRGDNE